MSAYREELLAAAKGLSDSLRRAEIAGMNLPYYVDVEWQRLTDAILARAEQQPAAPDYRGFAERIKRLNYGCAFDLTDSPKSYMSAVQKLLAELAEQEDQMEAAAQSAPHPDPAGQASSHKDADEGTGEPMRPALPGPDSVSVPRESMELLLDLLPRISDDDPMAPALADWCSGIRRAMLAAAILAEKEKKQ